MKTKKGTVTKFQFSGRVIEDLLLPTENRGNPLNYQQGPCPTESTHQIFILRLEK